MQPLSSVSRSNFSTQCPKKTRNKKATGFGLGAKERGDNVPFDKDELAAIRAADRQIEKDIGSFALDRDQRTIDRELDALAEMHSIGAKEFEKRQKSRKRSAEYYQEHRAERLEYRRRYYLTHKAETDAKSAEIHKEKAEYYRAVQRAWYEQHRKECAEKGKAYRKQNLDRIKEREKAYREKNKAEISAKKKAYCTANPEKIKARRRAYYEANREKILAKNRAYREARRSEKRKEDAGSNEK